MPESVPRSYAKLPSSPHPIVDPTKALVVHEIDAILRAHCPMQRKWISVRGKRTSCSWCPYLHKLRYTDWGGKIECMFKDGDKVHDFPMQTRGQDDDECSNES